MIKIKLFQFVIGLFLFCSCGNGEPYTLVKFYIYNQSSHNLTLRLTYPTKELLGYVLDTTFVIPTGQMMVDEHGAKGNSNESFAKPFNNNPDSAIIIFDDGKRMLYTRNDSSTRNLLNIKNYVLYEHNSDENIFRYSYTITDEDYDIAQR